MVEDSRNRATPGVYITELDAFPPSVTGVPTAVPAFIGYTEKAASNGKPVFMTPFAIASLADFESIFGGDFKPVYKIALVAPRPNSTPDHWDFQIGSDYYELKQDGSSNFYLYNSMRLFFNNGGSNCYVVSVGDYTNQGNTPGSVNVEETKLVDGINAIRNQTGPTMLVVPDATLLPDSAAFSNVVQAMLNQCGELEDRVAILDVYDSLSVTEANIGTRLDQVISAFQAGVGDNHLSYGMAYFPFLNTSVVQSEDIDYTCFSNNAAEVHLFSPGRTVLQHMLERVADTVYAHDAATRQKVRSYIDNMSQVIEDPDSPDEGKRSQEIQTLNQNLSNALPPYRLWQDVIQAKRNVLPPSGAMAGIFTLSDLNRGVWNAPANMTVSSVVSTTVKLNDAQQGVLNVPLNGKAIDVIRDFAGRGSLVWGARTLDGNSNDWRYIQTRRMTIYIEQSIKAALTPFVFAANNGQTWATVTSMISNFLQTLWTQGGLMGDKASDAFNVQCGLGSTMTSEDILNGYMIVQVTLQVLRPGEFITLTFKQKMQGA